ncbi:MAG: Imm27 family immunity protein [Acidobacteriota bacterium]
MPYGKAEPFRSSGGTAACEMIDPHETEIIGNWIKSGDRVVGDEPCLRVDQLTETYLRKIGRDWSGWETLFEDPVDGRYWMRTYPHGGWHGGGPPALINLTENEARLKFPETFSNSK